MPEAPTKPALKSPVVVFVFATRRRASTRFNGFALRLQRAGHLQGMVTRTVALDELTFMIIPGQKARIFDKKGQAVFDDAALVYFKSRNALPDLASAVANYVAAKGVPVFDEVALDAQVNKLDQLFRLWRAGIPVTPFYYRPAGAKSSQVAEFFGDVPYVVKPVHGEKGRGSKLVNGIKELRHTDTAGMLVQPYIPNDGDYRVFVYGYKVYGALYRQAAEGSHLNNTSAGASSTFIETANLLPKVVRRAIGAAKATRHNVAGVDIVLDKTTGKLRVLEVNEGPQIVTGHFVERKMAAFDDFVREALHYRYPRKRSRLMVIGRKPLRVSLPELGVRFLRAKPDTGAYSSALNATDIELVHKDGHEYLTFTVSKYTPKGKLIRKRCEVGEFEIKAVKNTSGQVETRYHFTTRLIVRRKAYRAHITLADRSNMRTPMLLGRRLLRGRFLINPELG